MSIKDDVYGIFGDPPSGEGVRSELCVHSHILFYLSSLYWNLLISFRKSIASMYIRQEIELDDVHTCMNSYKKYIYYYSHLTYLAFKA